MRKIVAAMLTLLLLAGCLNGVAEGGTFHMAGFDTANSGHDWENNLFFSRMEKITGVTFTFDQTTSSAADWKKHLLDLLDGKGRMPDVLFKAELTPQETMELYSQGKIIDLKPYLAENAPNLTALFAAHPDWERAVTLPDGSIPALPGFNELQNNNCIWINRNWLTVTRQGMPTTAEELTGVLRAFKTMDPNLNGRADEIPICFTSLWDLRFLGHAFGLVANDYYICADEAGQVQFIADSDGNRAFLEWLHQLWDEGLLDSSGFSAMDSVRAITDSKADIIYGIVFGPSILGMLPAEQVGNYDVLMPMTYEGQARYRDFLGTVIRGTYAVTSACQDPAAMVRWVDYLYSSEGSRLAHSGLPDVEYVMLSDGSWSWLDDDSVVANTVLKEVAIMGGADMPGYYDAAFQLAYDDKDTHRAVVMINDLKQQSVTPYPQVFLTAQQQERVDAIWAELGLYTELTQVHFITGDKELNDATWAEYCETIRSMGRDELVSIWQEALR